jgi:hypothetical protein
MIFLLVMKKIIPITNNEIIYKKRCTSLGKEIKLKVESIGKMLSDVQTLKEINLAAIQAKLIILSSNASVEIDLILMN